MAEGSIVEGFVVPIISGIFIGGITLFSVFFFTKGLRNGWKKAGKFALRYRILKKPYPQEIVSFCIESIENGIGWYDTKKSLLLNGNPESEIDEILWIYDQIINQLNKEKGGNTNGRKFKGSHSKIEATATKFPKFATKQ
jgi:intein/homing endonuclease